MQASSSAAEPPGKPSEGVILLLRCPLVGGVGGQENPAFELRLLSESQVCLWSWESFFTPLGLGFHVDNGGRNTP